MKPQLVYSVDCLGEINGIFKEDALDLSKLGKRQIHRISLIEFSELHQGFYIKWLTGPNAGAEQRSGNWLQIFATYKEAVDFETQEVNRLRLLGFSFGPQANSP